MAYEYRIKNQHAVYFITSTVHQWADVFTRRVCGYTFRKPDFLSKRKGFKDLCMGGDAVGRPD